jgi:hypothetical protein
MREPSESTSPNETALLEASIDRTRKRVATEVDALAERLSPSSIKHEIAVELQRRVFVALATLRKRPAIAVSVLGAGLLLLLWRARSRHA